MHTSGHRQICLDTETTGLSARNGDRVIEIGAVELIDGQITDRCFHKYINPEVLFINPEAVAVHGLTVQRLKNEPIFRNCCEELIKFIQGAELIIHNATFDVGFLNAEFSRIPELGGKTVESYCPKITDTLRMARAMRPGQKNGLDALQAHYNITDRRDLHGALIDAKILAKVYQCMTAT